MVPEANATGGLELDLGSAHVAAVGSGRGNLPEERRVEELVEYMQPAPPPGTGEHRYVFVLLEPDSAEDGGQRRPLRKPADRPHFGYGKVGKGVMDWAGDNGLVPVGQLISQSTFTRRAG